MYNQIITENIQKCDKLVLLEKTKSNTIEVLISKTLIDSNITHDEYVLVNDVLKDMKEAIKNPDNRKKGWI